MSYNLVGAQSSQNLVEEVSFSFTNENIPEAKLPLVENNDRVQDPSNQYNPLLAFLSLREIDIVKCLMHGSSAKRTAKELFISPRTVERHLENIKAKLDCRNKFELVGKIFDILNCRI